MLRFLVTSISLLKIPGETFISCFLFFILMIPKEAYLRAGQIHYAVCQKAKPLIREGALYLDIARQIEGFIGEYPEASLAFPVNLQPDNEVHYSPLPEDTRRIAKEGVMKVDVGVHVEGYIADGAFTVALHPEYEDLVQFTQKVLHETLTGLKPGMNLSEIGRRLDRQMAGSKYKIIRNLMGHQVNPWDLHSTKSVYVYENETPHVLEPGGSVCY